MITFKYQEQVSHARLMEIAKARLQQGYQTVIANRGEEQGENGEQIAYLISTGREPERLIGKKGIAEAIAAHLETISF